ncbi:MAG: beta strand repeat-containing protein [Thermoplasmata archaeon]
MGNSIYEKILIWAIVFMMVSTVFFYIPNSGTANKSNTSAQYHKYSYSNKTSGNTSNPIMPPISLPSPPSIKQPVPPTPPKHFLFPNPNIHTYANSVLPANNKPRPLAPPTPDNLNGATYEITATQASSSAIYENGTVIIGTHYIIPSGISITFKGITLEINGTIVGTSNVIEGYISLTGGSLTITNFSYKTSTVHNINSIVTNNKTTNGPLGKIKYINYYNISVSSTSNLTIENNTIVQNIGYPSTSTQTYGIFTQSSNTDITNTTFRNGYYDVFANASTPVFYNDVFNDSYVGVFLNNTPKNAPNSYVVLSHLTFNNNTYGMNITSSILYLNITSSHFIYIGNESFYYNFTQKWVNIVPSLLNINTTSTYYTSIANNMFNYTIHYGNAMYSVSPIILKSKNLNITNMIGNTINMYYNTYNYTPTSSYVYFNSTYFAMNLNSNKVNLYVHNVSTMQLGFINASYFKGANISSLSNNIIKYNLKGSVNTASIHLISMYGLKGKQTYTNISNMIGNIEYYNVSGTGSSTSNKMYTFNNVTKIYSPYIKINNVSANKIYYNNVSTKVGSKYTYIQSNLLFANNNGYANSNVSINSIYKNNFYAYDFNSSYYQIINISATSKTNALNVVQINDNTLTNFTYESIINVNTANSNVKINNVIYNTLTSLSLINGLNFSNGFNRFYLGKMSFNKFKSPNTYGLIEIRGNASITNFTYNTINSSLISNVISVLGNMSLGNFSYNSIYAKSTTMAISFNSGNYYGVSSIYSVVYNTVFSNIINNFIWIKGSKNSSFGFTTLNYNKFYGNTTINMLLYTSLMFGNVSSISKNDVYTPILNEAFDMLVNNITLKNMNYNKFFPQKSYNINSTSIEILNINSKWVHLYSFSNNYVKNSSSMDISYLSTTNAIIGNFSNNTIIFYKTVYANSYYYSGYFYSSFYFNAINNISISQMWGNNITMISNISLGNTYYFYFYETYVNSVNPNIASKVGNLSIGTIQHNRFVTNLSIYTSYAYNYTYVTLELLLYATNNITAGNVNYNTFSLSTSNIKWSQWFAHNYEMAIASSNLTMGNISNNNFYYPLSNPIQVSNSINSEIYLSVKNNTAIKNINSNKFSSFNSSLNYGITIFSSNLTINTISGNGFTNVSGAYFSGYYSTNSQNVIISSINSNDFYCPYGINIYSIYIYIPTISGNTFYYNTKTSLNTYGIYMSGSYANITTINGNNFRNLSNGLYIQSVDITITTISNNAFSYNAPTSGYGIYIMGTYANISTIMANDFNSLYSGIFINVKNANIYDIQNINMNVMAYGISITSTTLTIQGISGLHLNYVQYGLDIQTTHAYINWMYNINISNATSYGAYMSSTELSYLNGTYINISSSGDALYISNYNASISSSIFNNNTVGMYAISSILYIINSFFTGNINYGIYSNMVFLSIKKSIFNYNQYSIVGGNDSTVISQILLSNSTVGIMLFNDAFNVYNSLIYNTTKGVVVSNSFGEISNSSFIGIMPGIFKSFAISAYQGSKITVVNGIFENEYYGFYPMDSMISWKVISYGTMNNIYCNYMMGNITAFKNAVLRISNVSNMIFEQSFSNEFGITILPNANNTILYNVNINSAYPFYFNVYSKISITLSNVGDVSELNILKTTAIISYSTLTSNYITLNENNSVVSLISDNIYGNSIDIAVNNSRTYSQGVFIRNGNTGIWSMNSLLYINESYISSNIEGISLYRSILYANYLTETSSSIGIYSKNSIINVNYASISTNAFINGFSTIGEVSNSTISSFIFSDISMKSILVSINNTNSLSFVNDTSKVIVESYQLINIITSNGMAYPGVNVTITSYNINSKMVSTSSGIRTLLTDYIITSTGNVAVQSTINVNDGIVSRNIVVYAGNGVISIIMKYAPSFEYPSYPATIVQGSIYTYNFTVSDFDVQYGDALSYYLISALPGMYVIKTGSNTGQVIWNTSKVNTGIYDYTIIAINKYGQMASQNVSVQVVNNNILPMITSQPNTKALAGSLYVYTPTTINPSNGPLAYMLTMAPYNMKINPSTGMVTWVPTENQVGINYVSITVTASNGESYTQTFAIVVSPSSNISMISSSVTYSNSTGEYTFMLLVTDTPQINVTNAYIILNGMPEKMTLISGASGGVYTFAYTTNLTNKVYVYSFMVHDSTGQNKTFQGGSLSVNPKSSAVSNTVPVYVLTSFYVIAMAAILVAILLAILFTILTLKRRKTNGKNEKGISNIITEPSQETKDKLPSNTNAIEHTSISSEIGKEYNPEIADIKQKVSEKEAWSLNKDIKKQESDKNKAEVNSSNKPNEKEKKEETKPKEDDKKKGDKKEQSTPWGS